MVAKFPDTSRHRDQGRAETQTKARGCRGEGRGERDKYSNVVFMEVHRRGALEGAATRRRHCFPRSGNILGSWRKPGVVPLLYPGSFPPAFLISIVVDVPPTGCTANAHQRPATSTPSFPRPNPNPSRFQPLRLSACAKRRRRDKLFLPPTGSIIFAWAELGVAHHHSYRSYQKRSRGGEEYIKLLETDWIIWSFRFFPLNWWIQRGKVILAYLFSFYLNFRAREERSIRGRIGEGV